MRKFLIHLCLFLFLLIGASLMLHYLVYPKLHLTGYSWGSDLIHKKKLFLNKNKNNFNTVFFGSSYTFRQINPAVFDSVVNKKNPGLHVRSFNFGVNWLSSSELLFLLDNMVKTDSFQMKTVFVELQKIKMPDYENFFTTRVKYWYTWEGFWFTIKAAWSSNFPFYVRAAIIISHVVNYISHLFNLGYVTEAAEFSTMQNNSDSMEDYIGKNQNGFVSLAEQQIINKRVDDGKESFRTNRFLKDTSVVTKRMFISKKTFQHFEDEPQLLKNYNHVFSGRLNVLIKRYQVKGIQLIFFLPPRLDRLHYYEVIPLFNAIDEQHRINMADARTYSEFYIAKNSFDVTHMNEDGAAIYSRDFAEQFTRIISEK